ncbi:MAG: inositol monophosphatase family protein [Planctomycetota bacterium]
MADLDALLDFAKALALEAGEIQLQGLSATPTITLKSKRELVTPIDVATEEHVVARIAAAYPDHGYLAEERHDRPGAWRWIVDPIDGTTNFAQRLPSFAVSLGLEDPEGIALGVVYAPYLRELFWARRGGGAWFQRDGGAPRRMHVSAVSEVGDAVLATGFAYVRHESPNTNLDNWARLAMLARGVRRIGSAALDLAYVADGRFDAFWEMHLKPYDVAAGACLIREAGGRVTDFWGGESWLHGQTVIASNGAVHEALRAELAEPQPDPWITR